MKPRDTDARAGLEMWDQVTAPQADFREQVIVHTVRTCADGLAAALINDRLQEGEALGLAIRFDPQQLPALVEWRMLGRRAYVMGIGELPDPWRQS